MRILVVDDDSEILVLIRKVAEQLKYTCETLSHSRQFAATFARFKPNVVVLDVLMPHVDGIEIVQWLRDVDYTGHVILMSGNPQFSRMASALAEPRHRMVVSELAKPFRVEDLRTMLLETETH